MRAPRLRGRYFEWLGPLGRRIAVGSAAVALTSVVLVGALTLLLSDIDLTSAGRENEASSVSAVMTAMRAVHASDPDWKPIDLTSVRELARVIGIGIVLQSGRTVLLRVPPPRGQDRSQTLPVLAGGRKIATAKLTFRSSGLLPEEVAFRRSIVKSVAAASGLALLVAFGVAVIGSRRLVAPVRSLTRATRRLAAGDRASRVGAVHGRGELAELATAFDGMAERLEREEALRRALIADLAHELRTPLAVLQAQLEGIAAGALSLDRESVASLAEEASKIGRLVEDLRVLSEADALGLSLHPERADLAQVASNAAARVAPLFMAKGVHLSLGLTTAEVDGDPGRLEQVVVNLLSNAAKFSPAGGEARISVHSDGDCHCVVVTDTGRGIPVDEQDRVFDRFFRGAASHDTPGSGVGLAVVATLVAAHGGSVELDSRPGLGATFTVRLPKA